MKMLKHTICRFAESSWGKIVLYLKRRGQAQTRISDPPSLIINIETTRKSLSECSQGHENKSSVTANMNEFRERDDTIVRFRIQKRCEWRPNHHSALISCDYASAREEVLKELHSHERWIRNTNMRHCHGAAYINQF